MNERVVTSAETGAAETNKRLKTLSEQLNSMEPVAVAIALQGFNQYGIPSTPQQALQLCNVITSLALLLEPSSDVMLRSKCMQLIARMAVLHPLCKEALINHGTVKKLHRFADFSSFSVTEAKTALRTMGCLVGGLTEAPSQRAAMEELASSGFLRGLRNELSSRRPPDDVATAIGDFLASAAACRTNHIYLCEAGLTSLLPTWLDPCILISTNGNGNDNGYSDGTSNGNDSTGGFLEAVLHLCMSDVTAGAMRNEPYFEALARLVTYGSSPAGLRRTAFMAIRNLYGNSRADELLRRAGAPAVLAAALTSVSGLVDAGATVRVRTSSGTDGSQRQAGSSSGGVGNGGLHIVRRSGSGRTSQTVTTANGGRITGSGSTDGASGTRGSHDASNVGAVAWVNVQWAFGDGSTLGPGESNGGGGSPAIDGSCGGNTVTVPVSPMTSSPSWTAAMSHQPGFGSLAAESSSNTMTLPPMTSSLSLSLKTDQQPEPGCQTAEGSSNSTMVPPMTSSLSTTATMSQQPGLESQAVELVLGEVERLQGAQPSEGSSDGSKMVAAACLMTSSLSSPVTVMGSAEKLQVKSVSATQQDCVTEGGAFSPCGFSTSGGNGDGDNSRETGSFSPIGGSGGFRISNSSGNGGFGISCGNGGNGGFGTCNDNGGFGISGSKGGGGTSGGNGGFGTINGNGGFSISSGNDGRGTNGSNGGFGTIHGNGGFSNSSGNGSGGTNGSNGGFGTVDGKGGYRASGGNGGFSMLGGNGSFGTSGGKHGFSNTGGSGGFGTVTSDASFSVSGGNGDFSHNVGNGSGHGNDNPWSSPVPCAAFGSLWPVRGCTATDASNDTHLSRDEEALQRQQQKRQSHTNVGSRNPWQPPVSINAVTNTSAYDRSDDTGGSRGGGEGATARPPAVMSTLGAPQGLPPWTWSPLLGDEDANGSGSGGAATAATAEVGATEIEGTEDPLQPAVRHPRCPPTFGNVWTSGNGNGNNVDYNPPTDSRVSGFRPRVHSGGGTAETAGTGTSTASPLSYGCRPPAVRQRSSVNRHDTRQAAQQPAVVQQQWMAEYQQQQELHQLQLQQLQLQLQQQQPRRVPYGTPRALVGERVEGSTARSGGGAMGGAVPEGSVSTQSQLFAIQLELVRYELKQVVQMSHEAISYKIDKLRSDLTEQLVQLRFDLAGRIEALQAGVDKLLEIAVAAAPPAPPPPATTISAAGGGAADGPGSDPPVRVGAVGHPDMSVTYTTPPPPPPPTPRPSQHKLAQVLSASLAATFQEAVHKAVTQWQSYVAAAAAVPPPLLPLAGGVKPPAGRTAVGGTEAVLEVGPVAPTYRGAGASAVVTQSHQGGGVLGLPGYGTFQGHMEGMQTLNMQKRQLLQQHMRGGGGGGGGGGTRVVQCPVKQAQPTVTVAAAPPLPPGLNLSPVVRAGAAAWSGDGSVPAATVDGGAAVTPLGGLHGSVGVKMRSSHPGFSNSTFVGLERLTVTNCVNTGSRSVNVKNRNSHPGVAGIGGGGVTPSPDRPPGAVPATPNAAVPPRAGLLNMFDAAVGTEDAEFGGGGRGNKRLYAGGRVTSSEATPSTTVCGGDGGVGSGLVAAQVASVLAVHCPMQYVTSPVQMASGGGGGGGTDLARALYGGNDTLPALEGLLSPPSASRLVERSEVQHVQKAQQQQLLMLQQSQLQRQ